MCVTRNYLKEGMQVGKQEGMFFDWYIKINEKMF